MAVDAHANFAYSLVATAPSPGNSGTSLIVTASDGAKFPAVPFNATVWPVGNLPTTGNAEIVRVTARSTDTLTITRTQEGTAARTIIVGDQIAATVTAKTLTDVETRPATRVFNSATLTTAASVITTLSFDSERYDTDTIHDTVTNPSRLTCRTAGNYHIYGHARFAATNGATTYGVRNIRILLNGATILVMEQVPACTLTDITIMNISTVYALAVNDYVELAVFQNSSQVAAVNIDASGNYSPEFGMSFLV